MSLNRFFRRSKWDDERARELDAYLAIETDDNIARGMTPDEARLAAQRKLGNRTRIREEIYVMNSVGVLDTARLDVRDAWRNLRRRPLVTLLALLLLTIGIGASAAAFSITYGVLVRPLPFPDADRLVVIWQEVQGNLTQISYPDFLDLRAANLVDTPAALGSGRGTLSVGGEAERVNAVQGEPALLSLLGARALVGRLLDAGDEGRPVAVISSRLWRSMFRGDPAIVGARFVLSGSPYTVIGVAAEGLEFELPVGAGRVGSAFVIKDVDLWTPFDRREAMAHDRAISTYEALAKLKPGQTIEGAQRALEVVSANLARTYPATNRGRTFRVVPLHAQVVGAQSPAVLLGFAGALLILVVAFANLLSLFLGEVPVRRRDLALREALGASRGRLVRQIVVESALISAVGGTAGFWLARTTVESLKAAAALPRLDAIRFDIPVAIGVAIAALVTGLVARILPLTRLHPAHEGLRASASTFATSAPRFRRVLVTAQLALAVVLSAAAMLLGLSLRNVIALDPGFAASHALSVRVSAYPARYPRKANVVGFFTQATERAAAVSGVQTVAAGSAVPLAGTSMGTSVAVEGHVLPTSERPTAGWQTITPGYFSALGITLLEGRDFIASDLDRPAHVTVINRALARQLFGDVDPVGRRVAFGPDQTAADWHEVIGVAGDVRHATLTETASARAYDLFGQHWSRTMYLVARTSMDPYAVAPGLRGALHQLDPEAPIFDVQSLDDIVNGAVSPRRLATAFAIGIAAVSLLLAAIGLYGLLASAVAARVRELAIRRALGASTRAVVGLICTDAAWMGAIGAAVGIAASFGTARWIDTQLVGVHSADGRVIVVITALLVAIGGVAAWLPARRAARIEPAIALRDD